MLSKNNKIIESELLEQTQYELKDLVSFKIDHCIDDEKTTEKKSHIKVSIDVVANETNVEKQLKRPKVNLFAVIDVSGSMGGSPINTVKATLKKLVDQMNPEDSICIILFHSYATTFLTLCNIGQNSSFINQKIDEISTTGGTDIQSGLRCCFDEITMTWIDKDSICGVILLSDGQDNHNDYKSLFRQYEDQLKLVNNCYSVKTHTFGFGSGHDANTLKTIADCGNGDFYYVENMNSDEQKKKFLSAFCDLEEKSLKNNSFDIDINSEDPNYDITRVEINGSEKQINPQGKYELKIVDLKPNTSTRFYIQVETTQKPLINPKTIARIEPLKLNLRNFKSQTLQTKTNVCLKEEIIETKKIKAYQYDIEDTLGHKTAFEADNIIESGIKNIIDYAGEIGNCENYCYSTNNRIFIEKNLQENLLKMDQDKFAHHQPIIDAKHDIKELYEACKQKEDSKLPYTNIVAKVKEGTQNLEKNLKKNIAKEVQQEICNQHENDLNSESNFMHESKKSYSSKKTSRLFEKAKRVQQSCKEMFQKREQTVLETTTRIQNDVISTLNEYMELKRCHKEHLVEKELDDQKIFELEEQKNKLKLELSMQKTSNCEIQEKHTEIAKLHEMTCDQYQKELATRDADKSNLQEKLKQIESEKNSKEEKLKKQTLKQKMLVQNDSELRKIIEDINYRCEDAKEIPILESYLSIELSTNF